MKSTEKFDYPDLPAGILRTFLKLRGKPLTVVDFKGDFRGEEISDPVRLCREPAVSIVTITYNHGKYIAQCLDSILAQKTTFPFEIIVGEDCSTDNTRQIVLDYQRKYPESIRAIISDRNVGAIPNRVRVGLRARGALIASCEGDDYWTDPGKLQRQYEIMSSDASIGLCFSDGEVVTEPGARAMACHLSPVKPGLSGVNEVYKLLLSFKISLFTASTMIRNFSMRWDDESLYTHFVYSLSMGDLPAWLLASRDRKTYYFPQKMIARTCHSTSLVQTWDWAAVYLDCFVLLWYFTKCDGALINRSALTNILFRHVRLRLSRREYIQVWRSLILCFKCGLFFGRGGMLGRLVKAAVAKLKRIITRKSGCRNGN